MLWWTILLSGAAAQVVACPDEAGIQFDTLRKLPGASADLTYKLDCIKGKPYPKDIEICGIGGIRDPSTFAKVERCLRSGDGKVVDAVLGLERIHAPMLTVSCQGLKVGVEFNREGEKYRVLSIAPIVD